MTTCTRCEGTGFLNIDQYPGDAEKDGVDAVLEWIDERKSTRERLGGCSCHVAPPCSYCMESHDVQVCDCCGDGESWYGVPGEHYGPDDPPGPNGPYAGNGGLCQCH